MKKKKPKYIEKSKNLKDEKPIIETDNKTMAERGFGFDRFLEVTRKAYPEIFKPLKKD